MSAATSMSRAEFEKLLESDLLTLGQAADAARRERHGERATYVAVCEVAINGGQPVFETVPDAAQEVRVTGTPGSIDEAVAAVAAARAAAGDRALTGFSLVDLIDLAATSRVALGDVARRLAAAGLESVAEAPIDLLGDPVSAIAELTSNGLQAWRVVVRRAPWHARLDVIQRVADLHASTGAFKAFAPLPTIDDPGAPATGFDDVRTIAAARLLCAVPHIQVDWGSYGPKLAQVALTYGADDIDGVSPVDDLGLGWRRAPIEDVERNIRSAGQQPAARSGRFAIS